ncbi:MAG: HEPN domain-containing protein [Prevotella sp.]|nr:HEPN domain-containing protein [Prevotella sp.]
MDDESRRAVVEYRIERAYQTLDEAKEVAEQGWYNLSANRLYYALWYVGSALLISIGHPVKTHSGMIAQVNLHFVKTGILSLDDGALLSQMFSLRQSSDYEDFKQVSKEQLDELFPQVCNLAEKLKSLVKI